MPKNEEFDLIVVGGGSAGYAAARTFHEHGGRVAMVDGAKDLGGLCILRGCMPSKTLIYSAETLHLARQGGIFGFESGSPKADLAAMQERKKKVIAEFADYRRGQIEDGRFELFRSYASFFDPHTLALSDGQRLRGEKILVSTGSEVFVPPIPGLTDAPYQTSDDVLELSEVPPECIVLGGGVVACELAQFLARVGSQVTILQRSPRLLKEFPEVASKSVEQAMRDEGIDVRTGVSLKSFESLAEEQTAVSYEHEGKEQSRETGFLFLALGRVPATRGLIPDEIGLELLPSGHVQTNEFQQTSLPHIYAAGDCSGPHEIVHVAIRQGETAAFHALGKKVEPMGYDHLLTVVFTDPQVARVGLSPEQLSGRGIEFLSASYPFDDHGKSILMEAKHGYVAVHAEKATGRVLGAECVGKDAGELIHSLSVAVSLGATVHSLIKADWYHPTLSEIWTYPLEDLAEEIPPAS
jgi:pyruvate/2-oxoglutarate dehydrogenase complex dihydrolipoamide dehydrogenase (E3) component